MSTAVLKKYKIPSPSTANKVKMPKDATILIIEKPKADQDPVFIHALIDPKAKDEDRLVLLVAIDQDIPEKAGVHHAMLKFGDSTYHAFTEY